MSISTQDTSAQNPPLQTSNKPGFYLWVGVDPANAVPGSTPVRPQEIIEIAETLGELVRELLPTAQTHTTLSLPSTQELADSTAPRYVAPVQTRLSSPPLRPLPNAGLPDFDFALRPRVIIDLHTRQVIADDLLQRLTYKEFELLAHLVEAGGRVVSRDELFQTVWASEPSQDSRTIDVHVRRLREKLGLENHIITVRGRGYKFAVTDQIDVIEAVSRRDVS